MGYQFLSAYEAFAQNNFSVVHTDMERPSFATNDIPDYAVKFYQPTEHENFTSIKYGNFDAGYHGLKEVREDMLDLSDDFYVPRPSFVDTGSSAVQTKQPDIVDIHNTLSVAAEKEAMDEIKKAQAEIMKHSIKKIEVEETLVVKKRKRTIEFR